MTGRQWLECGIFSSVASNKILYVLYGIDMLAGLEIDEY